MATDQTESIAGRLIGPYHIATLIGKGGMGEVYLAHDTRPGRRIALKLLSPVRAGLIRSRPSSRS